MLHRSITSAALAPVALAVSLGWALPVHAQTAGELAVMRQEMAEMRAVMDGMASRIATLEAQLETATAQAESARTAALTAGEAAAQAASLAKAAPRVNWKGAPEMTGEGGWSFKPRGRLQFDAGIVSAPEAIPDRRLGFANKVRRARLGVEGKIPGGFGYRFDTEFSGGSAELYDAYLTYGTRNVTVTIGQHNNFQSLEEVTSSLNTSFMERAAFTDAFGFERRAGVSVQYMDKAVLVQAGLFTDNVHDLTDENNSFGGDGRVVYMPKLGNTQLHLGGSLHYRKLNDASQTVRYRQRPMLHTTGVRFIDTRLIDAKSETGYGLEAAAIHGPFHVAAEGFWQKVGRPGAPDPTFFGGSIEAGYFLTGGDSRGYKNGMFDRVRPANGLDKGGIGAIQVNLRYDHLNLNDAGVIGGKQDGYAISMIWTPVTYIRFMAQYGRLQYTDAFIATSTGDQSYGVDTMGIRAQFDF